MPPLQDRPTNPDALIRYNGELVESLFSSQPWKEIAFPLLQESIAGVSGRFTNGRYWHGALTTNWKENNSVFISGYQKALMDFQNSLHDFILAKEKLKDQKKAEEAEKKEPLYNPFMEDQEFED